MAVTKVFAIRHRMDDRVKYAVNRDKTMLDNKIVYAVNPEKTEQVFFTEAVNCGGVDTAFQEMLATKRRFGKTDGVLGYHFIQSFAPGEVTPAQAHAIGMEFARRMFGDRYEAVVGTHLDKAHLHNHIIVNSVSFIDGQKYHSSPGSYYNRVRGTSDELCRENQLSVISPQGKGRHYAEWKADKEGKPTIRSIIRTDIDRIIGKAYTYQTFLTLLQSNGYAIKSGPNRKYTAVRPPGAKRFIRLDSLGDDYTEDAIKQRLSNQRMGAAIRQKRSFHPAKRYRVKGKLKQSRRKITGFLALYFRYVYLLRKVKSGKPATRISFPIREEVIRLEQYQKQFLYLLAQDITTQEQLSAKMAELETGIADLVKARMPLYQERRNAEDETKAQYTTQINQYTTVLQKKRKELALCNRILETIPKVQAQMQDIATQPDRKEEQPHEYKRRNR